MPLVTIARDKVVAEEFISEVVCNACGKSAKPDFGFPAGFHVITLQGGYGDDFPSDMETFEIVVCCGCLEAWVTTFKFPDVRKRALYNLPETVKHHETGEDWILEAGWVRPANTELPSKLEDTVYPDEDYPTEGVWEHFKGNRYLFHNLGQVLGTGEHLVVYRALYGDSALWFRPLSQWAEEVDRPEVPYKGPRFRRVG